MIKNQLRKKYKALRNELTLNQKQIFNERILQNLQRFDWSTCQYLHIYLTLEKFNEPDTTAFIEWIKSNFPDIKLVISKSDFQSHTMTNYLWDDEVILKENEWGIVEPISGEIVNSAVIDVVLVPLLVVDKVGNRVGYGKGFYDRFLATCKSDVLSIGISFYDVLDQEIEDVGEWDVKLKYCVTPMGSYQFK